MLLSNTRPMSGSPNAIKKHSMARTLKIVIHEGMGDIMLPLFLFSYEEHAYKSLRAKTLYNSGVFECKKRPMKYVQSLHMPFTNLTALFVVVVLLLVPLINVVAGMITQNFLWRIGAIVLTGIISSVTLLYVAGYVVCVARNNLFKRYVLPEFPAVGHVLWLGVRAVLLGVVYWLPIFALSLLIRVNYVLGMSLSVLAGIVILWVFPSAVLGFASGERLADGLRLPTVVRKSLSVEMVKAWLVSLLFAIGYFSAAVILVIFTVITRVGPFVVTAVGLAMFLFSVWPLFAQAYVFREK
ncbi:DUF4013 domain-containing protein [Candidatus Woesearchaeota archaeon]|nr:DUF4013 domain-containing protein [Candidatus Woesearchaeota archaeon]